LQEIVIFAVTIIEIRPFRNGWQVYEYVGVQPLFLSQEQAVDKAGWTTSLIAVGEYQWGLIG
jgi:hypothetical protein